jgi:hypothetical protein
LRKWRNWQTHQLEGLAAARSWRFESSLPHQNDQRPAHAGLFVLPARAGVDRMPTPEGVAGQRRAAPPMGKLYPFGRPRTEITRSRTSAAVLGSRKVASAMPPGTLSMCARPFSHE